MAVPNHTQSSPASFFALAPFMAAPACYILVPAFPMAVPCLQPPVEPAARTPSGAGLPAPLLALMRTEDGPFLANEVFSVPPTQALEPIDEVVPAAEWYAITRGRFIGVVNQFALAALAISGVAHNANKAYTTQVLALNAFNQALTWGGVQVV
ncbi:hypothetical protein C8F04DRAFT_1258051 [Mycena alexandri]|uniref:Uncharacterized protein n=1 Tax=Mycena alexandri TaxID=1745969 RepID=A0AAD6X688_9AGAR|nr:hypothetical protein C8F04DRAFT_1258051 [Mycena alexandri]